VESEHPRVLLAQFIATGFKAVLVCVNENQLPESWAGRELDATILNDLPPSVDPCGENGEYHSFVYDGPIFKKPVAFQKGEMLSEDRTPHQRKPINGIRILSFRIYINFIAFF
jgi:diphthamide synthase (EF-2-diphthine--ammonia ligase)